jgi:hypothetical protein
VEPGRSSAPFGDAAAWPTLSLTTLAISQ